MTPPTKEQLDELRKLEQKTTVAPWRADMLGGGKGTAGGIGGNAFSVRSVQDHGGESAAEEVAHLRRNAGWNAQFIVAARNLLPALLADHERLQAENARLRQLLSGWLSAEELAAVLESSHAR